LLTEAEVLRSFRQLIVKVASDAEAYERAEELLDEVRAESPLRLRLTNELEEIRRLSTVKS
jgi:hypothetical protein